MIKGIVAVAAIAVVAVGIVIKEIKRKRIV